MKSADIRKKFLDYFKDKDHKIIPSSSLIPSDPTLLLTGAGMIQFKPIFLGKTSVDYTRAASVQKCVRTTDIENVGYTARHLTFFEMLGNFSFGDYYKKEICGWAWEFLTELMGLDKEKLWVTIFETDEEAFDVWKNVVKVNPGRIVRLGEKDNFWAAGPTGPCGPCSEIIYDYGPERSCGKEDCGVGCDCDRYLEIWNLVFMQYNRDEKGELHPLPKKNIDTGMGLERIASVLQGTETNFEIDIIKPLIDIVAGEAGITYGEGKHDTSLKIIADHIRAVTFLVGDGVAPANEGRGYILRRLLRRAVRHGRLIGIEKPFLIKAVDKVIGMMGEPYPELIEGEEMIRKVIAVEEERFNTTLKQGLAILSEVIDETRRKQIDKLSGEIAFKLYDTYGFPLELTTEIAAESRLTVDIEKFESLMEEQRRRARAEAVTAAGHAEIFVGNIYPKILKEHGATEFIGYEIHEAETEATAIVTDNRLIEEAKAGEEVEIFLKKTPFYAEMGGQVGDTGTAAAKTGEAEVIATYAPVAGLISHRVKIKRGVIKRGQTLSVVVDDRRRRSISRNHTATHLLHWALRIVIGKHVKQAGSLVEADRLRFDFAHHQPLNKEDVESVERLVNEKILQNHPVRAYTTTFDYAADIGALAFFEEKYGKHVRVVEIGDFSKELCGGVHLGRTSEVGFFHITASTSIGANTRRIEAITGERFFEDYKEKETALSRLAEVLGVKTGRLEQAAVKLKEELANREKEINLLRREQISGEIDSILSEKIEADGISLLSRKLEKISMDEMRQLADKLRGREKNSVIVLASADDAKANLLVAASENVVKSGFSSVEMIKRLAPIIDGGGGGRADLAQAGGKNPKNIGKIFSAAKEFIEDFVSGK